MRFQFRARGIFVAVASATAVLCLTGPSYGAVNPANDAGNTLTAMDSLVRESVRDIAPDEAAAAVQGATAASTQIAALAAKCRLVTAVTVTFADDPKVYSFDPATGAISEGGDVEGRGCPSAGAAGLLATTNVDKTLPIVTFTPAKPSVSSPGSPINISAQITYAGTNPGAFGALVTPDLYATAAGPANHSAIRTGGVNCSYNKVGFTPNYPYHYSCPSHALGITYKWVGVVTWPNTLGGTTSVQYWYSYRVTIPSGGPV